MTKFFADQFRKGIEICYGCSKSALKNYGFCATHLLEARSKFQAWSTQRQSKGVCIRCDRKGYMDHALGRRLLRCKAHTQLNRAQCSDWMTRHPEYEKQRYARVVAIRDAGFCPSCKEHPKLDGIHKRCDSCRARQRSYARQVSQTA